MISSDPEIRLANPSYPRLCVLGHTDVMRRSVRRVNQSREALRVEVVAFDTNIRIGEENAADLLERQRVVVVDIGDPERRGIMALEPVVLQQMEAEAPETVDARHKLFVARSAHVDPVNDSRW